MLTITPLPAHHLTPQDYPLADSNRFECRTCPYQMVLDRRYFERRDFDLRAAVEGGGGEVLGGQESWRNVDRTEVRCKNDACTSTTAYFRQVQIRSADEPMTTFYKCVKCSQDWREN
ncbi:RNA polymerase III C11 subunit [Friedmanniomyces endolithicus]|uniref:DNA-directed RNA polymerase subunit n=1 Tax=Friedmanniomyces endolithicus TaxID=329885 RepID=A0AAN6HCW4_9PEZI|nr:RNA polymerase III C11 subunit [Friedmanniomyces endolithicus]KAK0773407.1 RNA polymerase III C11 subunit [Friedmanniomyces endolithicus]KAK0781293.1 RNA polymerase III C11 subunit [Friedmanniomyces endolithicus]KAK0786408.1 RNA polymerase III C11 subunit [Friedmanniomyces endolithicus]KAK0845318.1 RNA polymerase III C11 subunit [Friedmanniomyces endolithicus]